MSRLAQLARRSPDVMTARLHIPTTVRAVTWSAEPSYTNGHVPLRTAIEIQALLVACCVPSLSKKCVAQAVSNGRQG